MIINFNLTSIYFNQEIPRSHAIRNFDTKCNNFGKTGSTWRWPYAVETCGQEEALLDKKLLYMYIRRHIFAWRNWWLHVTELNPPPRAWQAEGHFFINTVLRGSTYLPENSPLQPPRDCFILPLSFIGLNEKVCGFVLPKSAQRFLIFYRIYPYKCQASKI
jgi:hypothetical protein